MKTVRLSGFAPETAIPEGVTAADDGSLNLAWAELQLVRKANGSRGTDEQAWKGTPPIPVHPHTYFLKIWVVRREDGSHGVVKCDGNDKSIGDDAPVAVLHAYPIVPGHLESTLQIANGIAAQLDAVAA